jgi:hypothetical protein
MTPKYMIMAIVYAPPGSSSSVLYSNASTLSTTTSTSNMFGQGLTVGVTGNVVVTDTLQTSTTDGNSLQVSLNQTNGIQAFSGGDAVDHHKDTFYIWVHPQFNYSQVYAGGPIDISFVANAAQQMTPLVLDVNELLGNEPIPPDKEAQLLDLTPQDLKQISTADPFIDSSYKVGADRFQLVDELQLRGPDYAGAVTNEWPITLSSGALACKTKATAFSNQVSVGFTAGADFFGQGEKAEVIGSVTWSETSTTGNCNGNTQTATFTPRSTTVGYEKILDVYEDGVFHTFLFVELPSATDLANTIPRLGGVLTDQSGAPLANTEITVTLADGVQRHVYTDSQGNFKLLQVPIGTLTISSASATQKLTLTPGEIVLPNLTMNASAVPATAGKLK